MLRNSGMILGLVLVFVYNLSTFKYAVVQACGSWNGGVWLWKFGWRRGLCGREVGWLQGLVEDVSRCSLVEGVPDVWRWLPSQDGVFSVNSFYSFLQVPEEFVTDHVFGYIWDTFVPSNVKAFSWRLMLGRIPCKENLRRRHILHAEGDLMCSLCGAEAETDSHLLVTCPIAQQIWLLCYAWLGVSTALPAVPKDHFLQFSFGRNRVQRRAASSIWVCVVWTIWLWRNDAVFRSREADVCSMFELIKWRTWIWIKSKLKGFDNSFFEWTTQPLLCLQSL